MKDVSRTFFLNGGKEIILITKKRFDKNLQSGHDGDMCKCSILDITDIIVIEENISGQRAVLKVRFQQLRNIVVRHLSETKQNPDCN